MLLLTISVGFFPSSVIFQQCGEDNRDTKVAKDSSRCAENLKALSWETATGQGVVNVIKGRCNPCRRVM